MPVSQNSKLWMLDGGGQAAARDAAPGAKLEGGVVFGDVGGDSARTGVNIPVVDGDEVGCWFNRSTGTRRRGFCRGRGDGWYDLVQGGGFRTRLRKQSLQVEGERHSEKQPMAYQQMFDARKSAWLE